MKIKIKVLLAKLGLDIHNRGVLTVAKNLRDAGIEIIYIGNSTPEQIINAAVQEDVDVVGLSSLSGANMTLIPQTVKMIKENSDKNILFLGGGIIPQKDVPKQNEAGMAGVFGPGTPIAEISKFIKTHLN